MWGKGDEIFGPDGVRAFARDVPDAQIHLLDGGHFLRGIATPMVRIGANPDVAGIPVG